MKDQNHIDPHIKLWSAIRIKSRNRMMILYMMLFILRKY